VKAARLLPLALLPLAFLGLTGCVSVDAKGALAISDGTVCQVGEVRQQVVQMYFGRNIGQELGVSEADFVKFLDEEVTPRFPDGLTVQDGQGRWTYKGVLYKEPSKVVNLILPGKPDDHRKIGEIAAAYEHRFRQDAVLSVAAPACISFWLPKDRPAR
jgi:hypothetical protein